MAQTIRAIFRGGEGEMGRDYDRGIDGRGRKLVGGPQGEGLLGEKEG